MISRCVSGLKYARLGVFPCDGVVLDFCWRHSLNVREKTTIVAYIHIFSRKFTEALTTEIIDHDIQYTTTPPPPQPQPLRRIAY